MKEELYTIPVADGFKKDCECAFCAMKQEAEARAVGFIMSPSYMEEDVREQTNKLGFCQLHMEQLYAQKNALGLALMLQSHLVRQRMELEKAAAPAGGFHRRRPAQDSPAAALRREQAGSCYICRQTSETMERYLEAFFYLLKKDAAFQDQVWQSKGFCFDHFLMLLDRSAEFLSGEKLADFRTRLQQLEKENLDRLEEELDWFIKKFDYRYREEPWKTSKDALPRTILKINGQWM